MQPNSDNVRKVEYKKKMKKLLEKIVFSENISLLKNETLILRRN